MTGAEIPDLTDEQLNKIFTVAIKPKDLSEKNTLIQLFRCYRNKKHTGAKKNPTVQSRNPSPPRHRLSHVEPSIERNVVEPLRDRRVYEARPEVGFNGMNINTMTMTNVRVQKKVLWSKQPMRPVTRSKPRYNPYEDKRHRTFLNRSDYR